MNKRNVLLVAAEASPLARVGGVAEYVLGLGGALRRRGYDVRVAIPGYGFLLNNAELASDRFIVELGVGATQLGAVYKTSIDVPGDDEAKLPVYLLAAHPHFASVRATSDVYNWPNHEPWIAFCRGVIDFFGAGKEPWAPEVIHCQDAHAAMVSTFVKHGRNVGRVQSARTVLTIHNLLAQGVGESGLVGYAGLPWNLFSTDYFEFYGSANCFKASLACADAVNAVSRTYAQEICSGSDFGFGLEGVLKNLRSFGKLRGIVNGIDENRWRFSELKYDGSDSLKSVVEAKVRARKPLFTEWKWNESDKAPIISLRSRWDEQKGARILAESIPALTDFAKCVVSVWGVPGATAELKNAWTYLNRFASEHPDRLKINPTQLSGPDKTESHYAISDFFLMPSRYEPCGLVQMECQRYGVVPIVRNTGGLADTVSEDKTGRFPSPNGFVFEDFRSAHDMIDACRRAVNAYENAAVFESLVMNVLRQHNSWDNRIGQYETLYGWPVSAWTNELQR
jgi:starch synthase